MIALIRKNLRLWGYGKSLALFTGCILFSISGRLNGGIAYERHILSAVSDHYYLTYFVLPIVLLSCFSFIDDDGEPVILRFQSYHSYFLKKWIGGGLIAVILTAVQTGAILLSGIGLPLGNEWNLAAGATEAELFSTLEQLFASPLQAFVCFTLYQLIGSWLIFGICMWIGHFTGRKWTIRIVIVLYVLSAVWIKLPAIQNIPLTSFNHLLILHHNFGEPARPWSTGFTLLLFMLTIMFSVRFAWRGHLPQLRLKCHGTPQTVKVKSNEVVTVEFRNQPKGNLIVVKQDSVTKEPLEGVEFKITYADGSYVDAEGGTLSSTGLYRTDKAGKITISGISGTVVVTEIETIPGYTIDENTRAQTVVVNPNDTQTLHFYNTPIGGVEIIKVNEDNHSERIPNTTFEIRKVDDALVDTVTTDKNGRVFVALEDGSYYAKEVTSNKSFRLDDTPHYFEIKDGKRVTLQVTNKKLSGIVIHKIDSATGEGIYGVKFVLYDANKKPIGEYTSDDRGYIYIDEIPGGLSGRFYLRELEAAPGYTLDKQYKTVYVSPGKTVEIEWENTAVTGQIQIYKYAAEYNEVTGTAAGTPLKGAVYEIVNARSGKVVDYITTDARGVAASKPLPLTRYQLREVTAPAYWQLDPTVHDVTLEYPGQIIKLSAYDKPSSLGVSITKRGNAQVMAGQSMRYDLTVANTSNVPLESFFWHDKIPYDVARPTTLTTGTYSARLNYRVLYKTNYNASYQVLASNLLTSNNYSFSLNAIPMQAGEVVTDIYFDFGKVPVGFQSTVNPTLSVMVNGNAVNGYQMVNRADVGGKYQGTWQTATASWVTVIRRLWGAPTLPKTGY